jgi:hypothetical protein
MVGEENKNLLALVATAWTSILSDSPWGYKPVRTIRKFVFELLDDPFKLIAKYDGIAHELQKSLVRNEFGSPVIRPLFHLFRDTPVFKEYHLYYVHRDPQFLAYLLAFLSFAKKAVWARDDLEPEALRSWLSLEQRLGSVAVPDWSRNIRLIMTVLTADWSDFAFLPKHGSGAVAQRLPVSGRIEKNDHLALPSTIKWMYTRGGHRPEYSTCDELVGYGEPRTDRISSEELHRDASRLMFVPKTYKAVRSICMEPIAYQYAQQGVLGWMSWNMNMGLVSRFIRLKDQSYNRDYARLGSDTTELDTIDLSSASDSVKWDLVKVVFPSFVLKHLAATRSRRVELPDGTLVVPHKFAPMGSATCFPVQSLLYLCVAIYAGMLHEHDVGVEHAFSEHDVERYVQRHAYSKRGLLPPRIFGDDIVCDKRITSSLISLLVDLGFDVNTGKSFTGDDGYRESCGGHYAFGDDVTFYSLKTTTFKNSLSVSSVGSLIDAANLALDHHYKNVRGSLVRWILYHPIKGVRKGPEGTNPILFTEPDDRETSFALRSLQPHNSHLKVREWRDSALAEESTCKRFQRDEIRSVVVRGTKTRKIPVRHHWYYYLQWWRERGQYEVVAKDSDCNNDYYDHDSVFVPDAVRDGPAWRWTPRR